MLKQGKNHSPLDIGTGWSFRHYEFVHLSICFIASVALAIEAKTLRHHVRRAPSSALHGSLLLSPLFVVQLDVIVNVAALQTRRSDWDSLGTCVAFVFWTMVSVSFTNNSYLPNDFQEGLQYINRKLLGKYTKKTLGHLCKICSVETLASGWDLWLPVTLVDFGPYREDLAQGID